MSAQARLSMLGGGHRQGADPFFTVSFRSLLNVNEHLGRMKAATSRDAYRLPFSTLLGDLCRSLILPFKSSSGPGRGCNPRRFVIFGLGRTGSTLLASLLDSHPGINCQGELLSMRRPFPFAHVEHQRLRSRQDAELFGFHLKPWHITHVLEKEPAEFMRRLEGTGYRVVHLRRENIFLQALSQAKLFMYKIVQAKVVADVPKHGMFIDTELLATLLENVIRNRQLEDECLDFLAEPTITITYESDLLDSSSHQGTCERIFDFLGIGHAEVTSPLQIMSPPEWRLGVENPQEIEVAVRRKGFGSFIEEADSRYSAREWG